MGLFYRRPLCLFCALFILFALFFGYANNILNKTIIILLSVTALILIVLCFAIKKHKVVFIFCLLCVCSVILSMLLGVFRMEYREQQAERYMGKRTVVASVTDVDYSSEYTSVYTVKIENISGNKTDIKAQLVCAFPSCFDVGDIVRAPLELKSVSSTALGMTASQRCADRDTQLLAVLYDADNAFVKRFDDELSFLRVIFEKNGLYVIVDSSRDFICNRLDALLDEDTCGLAKGFLLGDRSDISTEDIRDFRRTGLSHIFAVSGMHITILLGSLNYILKLLFVRKPVRMAVVAISAIPMLAVTGFALSAWRSVIMLWIAYIFVMLSEDNDMPTALFISIALIIAVSPYAVYDIGMWLSFLATLGLVTVYPWLEEKIPYPKKGKLRTFFKFSRTALLIMIMTLVCNIFVLPLQWYIFGEISLVSCIANVIISPLSTMFMISILICIICGAIPFIGQVCVSVVNLLCVLIQQTVGGLSSLDLATVSLRYPFASVLVIIFTVSFVILLIVELKRKWLILIPIVSYVLAFSVSICIFNILNQQEFAYYKDDSQELITVSSNQNLAIIDMSNGAYFRYADVMYCAAENGAVCVDKIIFTKITKIHISAMDYFLRSNIVNTIYIPTPQNQEQRQNALIMAALAEDCGTDAYLYSANDIIELDGIELVIDALYDEDKLHTTVFAASEDKIIGYADAHIFDGKTDLRFASEFEKCDTLLIGSHSALKDTYMPCVSKNTTVVYMSEELYKLSKRKEKSYCNIKENTVLVFPLK